MGPIFLGLIFSGPNFLKTNFFGTPIILEPQLFWDQIILGPIFFGPFFWKLLSTTVYKVVVVFIEYFKSCLFAFAGGFDWKLGRFRLL